MAGIDAVRAYCGWHIAPPQTETVEVEGRGTRVLVLPSLRVTEVTEVRDEDGEIVTSEYKVRQNGVARGWWTAEVMYEFDITHGYDEMPAELQEIIDGLDGDDTFGTLKSRSVGPFSETYDLTAAPMSVRSVLDRYRLPSMA